MFRRLFLPLCCLLILSIPIATAQNTECVQAQNFIDVSNYVQTQDYPAPELDITCDENTFTVWSNSIPNFEFIPLTPGDLSEIDRTYTMPANPEIGDETTSIRLLGPVAVAVNGLPIYGPNEGGNLGYGDPYLDAILDFCNGHTGPGGSYHFHAMPSCLFDDYEGKVGLVVGYALDGFPILAPYACVDADCTAVEEVESSWQRTSSDNNAWLAHEYVEGSGDLDECNGMTLPDGSYAYFATATFPYGVACYRGTPTEPVNAGTVAEAIDSNFTNVQGGPGGGQGGPPNNDGGQGGPQNNGQGTGGQGGPPNNNGGGQGPGGNNPPPPPNNNG